MKYWAGRFTLGIKISRRNIFNLIHADDTTLMTESEEELKSLLMKVKERSGKVGWKLNTAQSKIMATGPITSWQIDGEKVEAFFFPWAPKSLWMLTAAMKSKDACSLGKKSYDKPRQCIKKQKHHFADKGMYSQSYGFSCNHGTDVRVGP